MCTRHITGTPRLMKNNPSHEYSFITKHDWKTLWRCQRMRQGSQNDPPYIYISHIWHTLRFSRSCHTWEKNKITEKRVHNLRENNTDVTSVTQSVPYHGVTIRINMNACRRVSSPTKRGRTSRHFFFAHSIVDFLTQLAVLQSRLGRVSFCYGLVRQRLRTLRSAVWLWVRQLKANTPRRSWSAWGTGRSARSWFSLWSRRSLISSSPFCRVSLRGSSYFILSRRNAPWRYTSHRITRRKCSMDCRKRRS